MKPVKRGQISRHQPRATKSEIRQTQRAGGSFKEKLMAYRDLHAHILFSSLGRLVHAKFTSGMTIMVLAIAIAMASGFYLLTKNLQQLTGDLEISTQISLFLKGDVTDTRARKLMATIKENPAVDAVRLVDKDQALKEFETYSGFGEAIKALQNNPLPLVIEILPKNTLEDSNALDELAEKYNQLPEVDFAQMDTDWVKRLQTIIELARRASTLLASLLAAAVLFITGNTIRLELDNRRDEVVVEKLVGATNAFIQRPFLYFGFWIGFLAGVLAWLIVTVVVLVLRQPIETLSGLYGSDFHVVFLGFGETLLLLLIASLLGIFGSWVVLLYQLRQLNPE